MRNGRQGCCLPGIMLESFQTLQQIAEFVGQIVVRTDNKMGEKPLELVHQVRIIAQVNADDRNPGAFQAADVCVAERQIVALCAFVHRVAIVQHNDEFPALRAVPLAVPASRFSQLQAPVQVALLEQAQPGKVAVCRPCAEGYTRQAGGSGAAARILD